MTVPFHHQMMGIVIQVLLVGVMLIWAVAQPVLTQRSAEQGEQWTDRLVVPVNVRQQAVQGEYVRAAGIMDTPIVTLMLGVVAEIALWILLLTQPLELVILQVALCVMQHQLARTCVFPQAHAVMTPHTGLVLLLMLPAGQQV